MARTVRWKHPGQTRAQTEVENRLDELDSNPFEAARRGGLPRTYIYEFLTGKKRSFFAGKAWLNLLKPSTGPSVN